jgi:hypothetical protein
VPIFKRSLLARLLSFLMPGVVEGEGGGGAPTITPELQAIIDAKVNESVTGLKTKNTELLGKLKDATTNLQRFDGIDPDAVRTILSKFASEEEAALIAKGEIDTVLNKRTERMQAENQRLVNAEKTAREKAEAKAGKLAARTLAGAIRDAAIKAGALPEAMEDIVLRAGSAWRLNDDGDPVAMNGEEIVLGKDGKSPLSPSEWAESLRETAPHLWPRAQGSGAAGSGSGARVTGQDIFKLPARERLTAARAQRK